MTPLSSFSEPERIRLTGRSELPKAKYASEPYYYSGVGPPPVPLGTAISFWQWNGKAAEYGYSSGYWIARASDRFTFTQHPLVFRIRNQSSPALVTSDWLTLAERVVTVLEAVAKRLAA